MNPTVWMNLVSQSNPLNGWSAYLQFEDLEWGLSSQIEKVVSPTKSKGLRVSKKIHDQDTAEVGTPHIVQNFSGLPLCFENPTFAFKNNDPIVCAYENHLYGCLSVPDLQVSSGNEVAPSRHCLDGDSSWNICSKGQFLCAIDSSHPWDVDMRAWKWLVGSFREKFVGSDISSSWSHRLSTIRGRGIAEIESDRVPSTSERFPSILAMREAKLRDWLVVKQSLDFTSHISCRDWMLDSSAIIKDLREKFSLKSNMVSKDFYGNNWFLGERNIIIT